MESCHKYYCPLRPPDIGAVPLHPVRVEYVPRVWYDRVIDDLQEACDDECAGCYEGYLDDVPERDKEVLGDMLTATFVRWAKGRGIKYWVDIPIAKKPRLYDIKTGNPL